jgi:hypothetical protein
MNGDANNPAASEFGVPNVETFFSGMKMRNI